MSSWDVKPLGEVCKTGSGGTPLKSRKEYYEGGKIPWLLSGEVSQGEIFQAQKFITQSGLDNSSAKMFPANTVLVAMYGATAGQVGILRFEASTNQAVCGIIPNERFVPEFTYYVLLSKQAELVAKAAGNAQPNISQVKIKSTEIPVPSLSEQKRIVSILDEVFAGIDDAIANTEKNLTNARELFDSYLNNIFLKKGRGWIEKKLQDTCVVDRGSSPRPIKQFLTEDSNGVNWIKIGDTKGITKYIKSTKQRITKEGAERSRKVEPGDFILTNSMSYGKPYIMATSGYVHDGWFVLRLKDDIETNFFYYLLTSDVVQSQFRALAAGSVVKNISSSLVKKAVLPIPPISQQHNIVENIERLSVETQRLEAICQQKLTALNELKQSILQKAFTGELTADAASQATRTKAEIAA